jgi:hypothetical protein
MKRDSSRPSRLVRRLAILGALAVAIPTVSRTPPLPPASRPPAAPLTAQERLVEARIQNQEAQALHYRTLAAARPSNLSPTIPGLLGFLGVVVGAVISFLGLRLQARNQERLEGERWRRSADDEHRKRQQARADQYRLETRLAAADLAKKIAAAAQSMTWVTWIARHDAEHFSHVLVKEHDERMVGLYGELVAAQVLLAALEPPLFHRMRPLVKTVYDLDARIALEAKTSDIANLGTLWLETYRFEQTLPEAVLGLFAEAPPVPDAGPPG